MMSEAENISCQRMQIKCFTLPLPDVILFNWVKNLICDAIRKDFMIYVVIHLLTIILYGKTGIHASL